MEILYIDVLASGYVIRLSHTVITNAALPGLCGAKGF